MSYEIREAENGQTEIFQLQPVVIGCFPDEAMARKVLDLLSADASEDACPLPALPKPAPDAQQPKEKPVSKEWTTEWTTDELLAAMERLKNGEKMSLVAVEYGKPFAVLRAKWAAFKKHEKNQSGPSGGNDMSDCSLCGRAFKPTPDRMDVCARCDND